MGLEVLLSGYARWYRARGIALGFLFLIFIAAMGLLEIAERRDPVIGHESTSGRVLRTVHSPESPNVWTTILAANGDTLSFFVREPGARPGDRVPLRVDVHRSGKRLCTFDREAWLYDETPTSR